MTTRSAIPGRDTVGAKIILNTPIHGFVGRDEICRRVGGNPGSVSTVLSRAVKRGLVDRMNAPHSPPQGYRLTQAGWKAKLHLEPR